MKSLLLSAFVLFTYTNAALAVDLTKIDRTIRKEPAYQGKPKYCLLVFGPEAKTRVWLVQDGATLYVDRNGSGDLTEAGKKVEAKKNDDPAEDDVLTFEVAEIADGDLIHRDLRLYSMPMSRYSIAEDSAKEVLEKNPNARSYRMDIDVQIPGLTGSGIGGRIDFGVHYSDTRGMFQFADSAQSAPIVHFGGPLHVSFWSLPTLRIGRNNDVILCIGTPGVGPGTTAYVSYEKLIADSAFPKMEIVFLPQKPGDVPVKELYEIKQRC